MLRAVSRSDGVAVTDEISQLYQTAAWDKPAKLALNEITQTNGVATIEARAFDKDGVPCLDAANVVRFGLTGDGRLLDDLGTDTGSRVCSFATGARKSAFSSPARPPWPAFRATGSKLNFSRWSA